MDTLSVCIVTKNEEKNIAECLMSVSWADEIIVIDSLSTDKTVDICRQFTNKILITEWKGCGPQKKQVFEMATCDWVLMIDADERVSSELKKEILDILDHKRPQQAGYNIPFQSHYCGKPIRFGDWINEHHLRLFQRQKGTVVPRLVHFRVEVDGKIGKLKGKIIHHSFPDVKSVLKKMDMYSTDGAEHKYQQGKQCTMGTAIGHGLFAFFRGYLLKLGFLDGKEGFMLAISNAEGAYYRYLKLMDIHRLEHP